MTATLAVARSGKRNNNNAQVGESRGVAALHLAAALRHTPALDVNPARPITHRVTVQLIQTALDNGTSPATVFGNATQRADIEAGIDTIWAQAGIDMLFLPDVVRYNDTFAYQGNSGSGTRPTSDLSTIRNNAQREGGILNADSDGAQHVHGQRGARLLAARREQRGRPGPHRRQRHRRLHGRQSAHLRQWPRRDRQRDGPRDRPQSRTQSHRQRRRESDEPAEARASNSTQSQINTVFTATNFVKPLPAVLAGDFNHDGTVDAADYTVWRNGARRPPTPPTQYNDWKTNFGESRTAPAPACALRHSGATGSASAVPEPAKLRSVCSPVAAIYLPPPIPQPRILRSHNMNGFHRRHASLLPAVIAIAALAIAALAAAVLRLHHRQQLRRRHCRPPLGRRCNTRPTAWPPAIASPSAPATTPASISTRSGTAAAPIEFFAEPGVLINQPNPVRTDHGINLENASHVVIDGFEVTGMNRAGVRSVGVNGNTFASHVTIRNVHSYDNGYWGIFTGFVNDLLIENNRTSGSEVEHGIYVSNSGDRPTIRNNVSWDNNRNGIHMNGDAELGGDGIISNALITGNIIYGNGAGGGSGINMDGVQNSRIENNLLYDNHASGISLYRIDGGGGSNGNVVVNNTIHIASNGRWALNIQDGSTGNTVFNNILLNDHSFRGAIDVCEDSLTGFDSDYNVMISRFTSGGTN